MTLVEENAVDDALDRLVQRSVVKDDVGGLAAKLECCLLAGSGDCLGNDFSDLGGAGEGDLLMPGWFTISAPVSPKPVTMFTTPAGNPACWQTSANISAVSGVDSAGFRTTVLPAARAGAIFQASIISGKFQGMI